MPSSDPMDDEKCLLPRRCYWDKMHFEHLLRKCACGKKITSYDLHVCPTMADADKITCSKGRLVAWQELSLTSEWVHTGLWD